MLECGWCGYNMGIIICNFNLDSSSKMSYGILECDIVMLHTYDFVIVCNKKGIICARPCILIGIGLKHCGF